MTSPVTRMLLCAVLCLCLPSVLSRVLPYMFTPFIEEPWWTDDPPPGMNKGGMSGGQFGGQYGGQTGSQGFQQGFQGLRSRLAFLSRLFNFDA